LSPDLEGRLGSK